MLTLNRAAFYSNFSHGGELSDFLVDAGHARLEGHVHEFGLGVHLEATLDNRVHLVLDGELLVGVGRVGLEGSENLGLLRAGQLLSRDDGDLLFFVEKLVELLVLQSDVVDLSKALVLGENSHEVDSQIVERRGLEHNLVELLDLFAANTGVLSEQTEVFRGIVKLSKVHHVFVHVVKSFLLGGGGEKDASVAALNGVLGDGALMAGGSLHNWDITDVEV